MQFLYSERYGEYSDYTRKGGVICSHILLPPQAPPEYQDRQTLWNAVEEVERHKDAQLAYSFDIALQNEFSLEENIALARQFLLEQFVSRGMVVDFAIHQPDREDGGIPNPHFHVLCLIRPIREDGKWGFKQRRVYRLDEDGNRILDEKGKPLFDARATAPPSGYRPDLGRLWEALRRKASGLFETKQRDERKSRINAGVAGGASGRSLRPAVRVVTGVLRCIKSGVKIRPVLSPLRSQSPTPYCHNEKTGVTPRKAAVYGQKREICFLSHPGKESHSGAPVSGGRKPEYDRLRRAGGGLLPGLPQRQRRRPVPPHLHQILPGRAAWTAGGAAVLHCLPAGGGAGHGGWHPRRRLSVQRLPSPPPPWPMGWTSRRCPPSWAMCPAPPR